MQDFKKLKLWPKAHSLTLSLYRITRSFPSEERFGLTSQVRSAAISICGNLAEGRGRASDLDFRRFLIIAMGSLYELEANLIISRDLGFLPLIDFSGLNGLATELRRMLLALIRELAPR